LTKRSRAPVGRRDPSPSMSLAKPSSRDRRRSFDERLGVWVWACVLSQTHICSTQNLMDHCRCIRIVLQSCFGVFWISSGGGSCIYIAWITSQLPSWSRLVWTSVPYSWATRPWGCLSHTEGEFACAWGQEAASIMGALLRPPIQLEGEESRIGSSTVVLRLSALLRLERSREARIKFGLRMPRIGSRSPALALAFSRSSWRTRSLASLVIGSRSPVSISVWRTQIRRVSGGVPNLRFNQGQGGLSSSHDSFVNVPLPLRREILRHPLQNFRHLPWPSSEIHKLGSLHPLLSLQAFTTL
jgi:hypothetical protein